MTQDKKGASRQQLGQKRGSGGKNVASALCVLCLHVC